MKMNLIAVAIVVLLGGGVARAQTLTSTPQSQNLPGGAKQVTASGTYSPGAGNAATYIVVELGYLSGPFQQFTSFVPPATQTLQPLNPNLTYTGAPWTLTPVAGTTYVVRAKLYGFKINNPGTIILLKQADGTVP